MLGTPEKRPHHAHGLDRKTFDHFSRLREGVNYAPPWIDENLRDAVEKAGANVPRRQREKGASTTIKQAGLDASKAKPTVVRDVEAKQIADFSDPKVCSYCAAVLTKHLMDAAKAARELRLDLAPGDSAILAHQIRNSPEVRARSAATRGVRPFRKREAHLLCHRVASCPRRRS
jgi:hypothetical protein